MTLSTTRLSEQLVEGPVKFKVRPQSTDNTAFESLDDNAFVTASQVKQAVFSMPDAPSAGGTYNFTCTVSGEDVEYSWSSVS